LALQKKNIPFSQISGMKKYFLPLLSLILVAVSCSKNATDEPAAVPETPKPVSAEFKISTDNLFESQDVTLTPADTRAGNTYFWDFGMINNKHVVSYAMSPVMNIKWHGNYYVTLTVTDAKGNTANTKQFMPVLCNWNGIGIHP
jgi:PKD repeat protein